jgi:hypothetical protein
MSRLRMAVIAVMSCCAVMLVSAGTAAAQDTPVQFTKKVVLTGKNKGKDFTGTYTIKRFENRAGELVAVGTLKGTLKNRRVTRRNVAIPAALTGDAASAAQAGTCRILHLELGPLDLNLLGLRVQLNKVVLDITAIRGPGNLLGNLLCALTGLLDNTALSQLTGAINELTAVLNSILALVQTGPATAAVSGPR